MKQTLVISYTPRNGSYTKILLDEFLQSVHGKTKVTQVDLVSTPPDLLLKDNLNLIMHWNNGKRDFSEEELAILSNHNLFIEQVLDADFIVLAFPIYNFSMPATVKAWVDAIVVSNKTFSFHPDSGFSGLCKGKKSASIIVSGFDYNNSGDIKEYASATIKQNFDFLGMESEIISAFGVDQNRAQLENILDTAKSKINLLIKDWYSDEA
ncbi:NAD(P)H-dependent oxidoreductase [Fulvivirga sediminis]|uniref:FMN dependent NADH:quinone oxidoreductase n=1 Tax=Fulvivirga sediminis TaxID=2803949 RepID=A0A937K1U6_9BACT|nr:NAD(P)H-dependent oxidoreductase [Fulvivirga sediminis]MBL3658944.1 NAD(P)H-dependent oxidoreductase [Fulvivirga sediminis]